MSFLSLNNCDPPHILYVTDARKCPFCTSEYIYIYILMIISFNPEQNADICPQEMRMYNRTIKVLNEVNSFTSIAVSHWGVIFLV